MLIEIDVAITGRTATSMTVTVWIRVMNGNVSATLAG
jgi:hypothetical protein